MRKLLFSFVLALLTSVVSGAAIPQRDLPETRYNEVDQPVNQATPTLLGLRFLRPVRMVVLVPYKLQDKSPIARFRSTRTPFLSSPPSCDSHSLQQLLCTLLL